MGFSVSAFTERRLWRNPCEGWRVRVRAGEDAGGGLSSAAVRAQAAPTGHSAAPKALRVTPLEAGQGFEAPHQSGTGSSPPWKRTLPGISSKAALPEGQFKETVQL